MSSAADVQNTNGILTLPRFQKCMGRVPSDEKFPGDMSDEGKCTVRVTSKALCPVSRYVDRAYLWAPALGTGHTCGSRRLRLGIPVGPGAWDWAYLWVPPLGTVCESFSN